MDKIKNIREETIKKWDNLGFLDGLKGYVKENIPKLFECCKTANLKDMSEENKFISPGVPVTENDGGQVVDYRLRVKCVNKSNNPDPEYATNGASGFDLRAFLTEPVVLKPLERQLIPTGLYFELLPNIEIQVRPRSGLAVKNGVTVLNTPGTIDSDYRGEVKVILINLSNEDFTVNNGERIAQAVVAIATSKNTVNLDIVDEINTDTTRGASGFGSTGLH
jgi:dUTP pyrophosphatase